MGDRLTFLPQATLEHGSIVVNENGQMILGSITDKRGSTICFPDGFNAFIKMVRPSKKSGDPIDIDRVMVADGILSVEILGVIYEFDMTSGQLKTIFNRNTNDVISRNDIDNTMKEFSERLASYLNIDLDKTIAIGDNYNDVEMIKQAKLGVCVACGDDEIKSIANYVTKLDYNQGAVKEVIEKFILEEE